MKSKLSLDPYKLNIFLELIKRRSFVGTLTYDFDSNKYTLIYDKDYINSKHAIPLGPELDIFKQVHISKKNELFPSLTDRIPDKDNPAYEDYCKSQGISPNETNMIVLLGSIGRRGPSSFIFEKVYKCDFDIESVKEIRESLDITQHDFAKVFGISIATLQKLEYGTSKDNNVLKLLEIYFSFPEVAIWQIQQNSGFVSNNTILSLLQYFESQKKDSR